MKINREKTAALVIDYQERLMPVIADTEQVLDNTVKLLEGLQVMEIPMVITQQYTKGLGMSVPEIYQACETEDYVEKLSFSSFADEKVRQLVADKEIVLICGVEAHICVLQTVIDVKEAGKVPVLVADCISSRKKSDREIALKRAEQEGAVITSYESVLFELLGRAGTSESKAIQKIIK